MKEFELNLAVKRYIFLMKLRLKIPFPLIRSLRERFAATFATISSMSFEVMVTGFARFLRDICQSADPSARTMNGRSRSSKRLPKGNGEYLGFATNSRGNIAVTLSLLALPLFAAVGLAIDYGMMTSKRAESQNRADSAALAAARLIALGGSSKSEVIEGAKTFALSTANADGVLTVQAEMLDDNSITVTISENWAPIFAHLLNEQVTPIVATATARSAGGSKICVLALSSTMSSSVTLTGAARIDANGCSVYSNSTDRYAITSYKDSMLKAALICSAGGTSDGLANFSPLPVTDCPAVADPLSSWPAPPVGNCDYLDMEVISGTHVLNPGVYCGGLLVTGSAKAELRPGVYVMKDGPLEVTKTASLTGDYVGVYLTGNNAVFLFANTSSVGLSAPKDGPMAGLLFFEDRSSALGRNFEIVSENARRLVGTIYLPRGNFLVSSKKPVADLSAYTAIVANSVQLYRYPALVLNSNYDATDVPLPSGLAGAGSALRLSR